jgi:hypothetical protein
VFFLLSYIDFVQQNQRTKGWSRFCLKGWWWGLAQIMYTHTHVSKCKNDKIKLKKIIDRKCQLYENFSNIPLKTSQQSV